MAVLEVVVVGVVVGTHEDAEVKHTACQHMCSRLVPVTVQYIKEGLACGHVASQRCIQQHHQKRNSSQTPLPTFRLVQMGASRLFGSMSQKPLSPVLLLNLWLLYSCQY